MTQFLRDQASDREEVVTPLMLDGTYLSRNFATLGPMIRQPPCDLTFISFIFLAAVLSLIRLCHRHDSFILPSACVFLVNEQISKVVIESSEPLIQE